MLSIVIGDSPDHLINLVNTRNLLTTLTHTMDSTSIYEIETDTIFKKEDVENIIDWISSMINILTSSYDELPELQTSDM